ncbi:MAG TPA: DegV family EDD domain-containing protein, partial [Tenericutes bacterium]|nr:DegV family EDD domain-containing protein [Mycoplasmatota bacterium]
MKNYVLTCCSTVDLPADYFKKRDVPFIGYHFILDDKEYIDDLGKTISYEDFYQKMKEGAMPRTSQINTEEFINFFEPFLKEKKDILHIAFSSGLSGTYNSACLARDELKEKYPERKIIIIDSLAASLGYGLLVDAALDL